jgi:2,3-bisphosphoglycerate-dependent phosphoglycerate mutase
MTIIFFVRHAHSTYTPDEYNRPLSEKGKIEASKLAHVFDKVKVHAMYASNYLRAYETIEPIATQKGLTILKEELLNERVLSSTPLDDFQEGIQKVWYDPSFAFPGGESNEAAQKRVRPIIEHLLKCHPTETIIIGTHGNILTLLLNDFNNAYGLEFWENLKMPDIVKAVFEEGNLLSVEKIL